MRRLALALLASLCAGGVLADAPDRSPRPPARGKAVVAAVEWVAASVGSGGSVRGTAAIAAASPWAHATGRTGIAIALTPRGRIETVTVAGAASGTAGTGVTLAPAAQTATPFPLAERVSTSGLRVSPRPPPRPQALERVAARTPNAGVVMPASSLAVPRSPRPAARPDAFAPERIVPVAAAAIPVQPDPRGITGRRGALCGDPRLKGESLAPIASRIRGCGQDDPVRIAEVSGLRLSAAATVDCPTARALADWVDGSVKPAVGRRGGGVAGLEVYASYNCRPRNNQAGAKVSEHGRGHAVDIGGIILKNGARISVLDHWRDEVLGPLLKAVHRGACGPFGTVLGPAADRFHQDHLHLDTARYRSGGAYCR